MKTRITTDFDGVNVHAYLTETPNPVAALAMQLIDKHATIAAVEDGEDSGGRQKLRLQTPAELVERCFEIARLAYAEAEKRGYMVALPDLNEVNAEFDAQQDQETKKRAAKLAASAS